MDRSSRVRSGTLEVTSILPPMCSRKVRSETLWTVTPCSPLTTSTISSACSLSVAEHVTSTTRRSWRDSATSRAVTMPPAEAMPVATRPTTAGSTSVCSRIVIEYDALVAALRFLRLLPDSSAMPASCPASATNGERQRQDGRGARFAKGLGREGEGPAGGDEVVDQQHRTAVEGPLENEGEAAAHGRHSLGGVRGTVPRSDVGVDDAPTTDDGERQ